MNVIQSCNVLNVDGGLEAKAPGLVQVGWEERMSLLPQLAGVF